MLVGSDHEITIAYSKQENAIVERANKEVNRHLRALFYDRRIKTAWRECVPLAHRILNTNYFKRTKMSPVHLLFGPALNLDRGVFLSDSKMSSNNPESLSTHMAKMLKPQSDLMHVHRQILQSTDAEMLAKAPHASHAFKNNLYVLLI